MWKSNPFISELVNHIQNHSYGIPLFTNYDSCNIWVTLYHNFCKISSNITKYPCIIKYDTTYEEAKLLLGAYLQFYRRYNGNFSFRIDRDQISIYNDRAELPPKFCFLSRWYESLGMIIHTESAINVIMSMEYSISYIDGDGGLTPDEFIAIFDSRMSLVKRAN